MIPHVNFLHHVPKKVGHRLWNFPQKKRGLGDWHHPIIYRVYRPPNSKEMGSTMWGPQTL